MKNSAISVAFALIALSCFGADVPPELAAARARHEAAVAAATKPLRDRYVQELQQLKSRALLNKNLELAVAVDAEIKALTASTPKASPVGSPVGSATSQGIPKEALKGRKSYYLWVDAGGAISWDSAQAAAKAAGGNLVSINDRKEWDEILEYAAKMRSKSQGPRRFWLGAFRNDDGIAMWLDGTKFTAIVPLPGGTPEEDFHIQINAGNAWGVKNKDKADDTNAYIIEWPRN